MRASSRSRSKASSVAGSLVAAMICSASMPGTHSIALRNSLASSRNAVLVNCANWSARKTAYSRSGASRRVATTTRHIGHVPWTCSRGSVANGIPRSRKLRYPRAWPGPV